MLARYDGCTTAKVKVAERGQTLADDVAREIGASPRAPGIRIGPISASIGITESPRDGNDASELIQNADAAMYAAKRAGGSTCVVYHPGMEGDAGEQLVGDTEQWVERLDAAARVGDTHEEQRPFAVPRPRRPLPSST